MKHGCLVVILFAVTSSASADSPKEVFEKRLLPIFRSPDPSSCVQCHLAGVDLKSYIRPTHEATFVALRDRGLIDLARPESSKILTLIQRGDDDQSGAALIHQKSRKSEFEAFASWIKECAADPTLRSLPKGDEAADATPVEVIRHARKDRLAASFENTIWALRFRCMSCHLEGSAENQKLVAKHGTRVAWFKSAGPAATLDYLASSRLIDVDDPRESRLLKKPLLEVEHGGGKKMLVGDQGYRLYLAFLEDFAKIKKNAYTNGKYLPASDDVARFGTELWLKLTDLPESWGDRLIQVDVYAWDAAKKSWETSPIATSDRQSWGKGRLWQHSMTLLATPASTRAKSWQAGTVGLPQGKYLIKVYSLAAGKQGPIGAMDFAGQVETNATWNSGYGRMTVVDARQLILP